MTTIVPRASSSWTRNGLTSMIRASTWRSLVMIPDWLPVKLIASPPSSRIAMERSAIEMRSPADSSMSSSRRAGLSETCLAVASRSSVVSPMADTTTTTSCPCARVRMTRSATCVSFFTSATLLPPYFCTMIAMPVQHKPARSYNSGTEPATSGSRSRTSSLLTPDTRRPMRLRAFVLSFAIIAAFVAPSSAQQAAPAPLRSPDVIFVPTPQEVVDAMLKLAKVGASDVVYDLGSGDGRIPITAARTYGARGVGIDIDPQRIREATENLKTAGVADKVRFLNQDLFTTNISEATVVTLYLLPSLNLKLIPKLNAELKPGTLLVSHAFDMGPDIKPKMDPVNVNGRTVYYYTVPIQ